MANFCGKCGAPVDAATGRCPNCDREPATEPTVATAVEAAAPGHAHFCPYCGGATDPQTGACVNPACTGGKATSTMAASETAGSAPVSHRAAAGRPETKKPKKKKPVAVTTALTVLLSVALFITSLLAVAIYDVRSAIRAENLENLFESVELTELLDTAQLTDSTDLQRFYNSISRDYGVDMTDSKLNEFVNRSTVREFLAKKAAELCDGLFSDEEEFTVTKREVLNLLQKNSKLINEEFGVYLTDSDLREIADWIFDTEESVAIPLDIVKDSAPTAYYAVTIGFSYVTMAVFLVLSVLIAVLMCTNSLSQAAVGIGVDFCLLGGLFGLAAIFASRITPLWNTICGDSLVGLVAGNLVSAGALVSGVLFAVGVALLVVRKLVLKMRGHAQKGETQPV